MRRPTAISLAGIFACVVALAFFIVDVDAKIRLHSKSGGCCFSSDRTYGCASGDCSSNVASLAEFTCRTCASDEFCSDSGSCSSPSSFSSDCCILGNGDLQQYCSNGSCNRDAELVNATSSFCDFCGNTVCSLNGVCIGNEEFCYFSDFSCKDFVEHLPWLVPVCIVGFVMLLSLCICCCVCRARRQMRNRPVTVEVTSVWLFWRHQPRRDQELEKPPPPYTAKGLDRPGE